jgi:large subunit ribosomal protein L29
VFHRATSDWVLEGTREVCTRWHNQKYFTWVEQQGKTVDELRDREKELAKQLFALRLQKVTGQIENPSKIRTVRKDMARVLTVINEKSASGAGEA